MCNLCGRSAYSIFWWATLLSSNSRRLFWPGIGRPLICSIVKPVSSTSNNERGNPKEENEIALSKSIFFSQDTLFTDCLMRLFRPFDRPTLCWYQDFVDLLTRTWTWWINIHYSHTCFFIRLFFPDLVITRNVLGWWRSLGHGLLVPLFHGIWRTNLGTHVTTMRFIIYYRPPVHHRRQWEPRCASGLWSVRFTWSLLYG